MSARRNLVFVDTVSGVLGGEGAAVVLKAGRWTRFACITIIARATWPVIKEQENNEHRGHVLPLSGVDAATALTR